MDLDDEIAGGERFEPGREPGAGEGGICGVFEAGDSRGAANAFPGGVLVGVAVGEAGLEDGGVGGDFAGDEALAEVDGEVLGG